MKHHDGLVDGQPLRKLFDARSRPLLLEIDQEVAYVDANEAREHRPQQDVFAFLLSDLLRKQDLEDCVIFVEVPLVKL